METLYTLSYNHNITDILCAFNTYFIENCKILEIEN